MTRVSQPRIQQPNKVPPLPTTNDTYKYAKRPQNVPEGAWRQVHVSCEGLRFEQDAKFSNFTLGLIDLEELNVEECQGNPIYVPRTPSTEPKHDAESESGRPSKTKRRGNELESKGGDQKRQKKTGRDGMWEIQDISRELAPKKLSCAELKGRKDQEPEVESSKEVSKRPLDPLNSDCNRIHSYSVSVVPPGFDKTQIQWPQALDARLLYAIHTQGWEKPTIIQTQALSLEGSDIIGVAPTGSGKTLAFVLPVLQDICSSPEDSFGLPTALILAPTRELAFQIRDATELVSQWVESRCTRGGKASSLVLTGGLHAGKQERVLKKRLPDIVIATPGRLADLLQTPVAAIPGVEEVEPKLLDALKGVKFLILDEADRMVHQGKFQELRQLMVLLDWKRAVSRSENSLIQARARSRFTMVYSATLRDENVRSVISSVPFRSSAPATIDLSSDVTVMPSELDEYFVECGDMQGKDTVLAYLLRQSKSRTLVFVNTMAMLRRLVSLMSMMLDGSDIYRLMSHMPQKKRLISLERFRNTPQSVLIATDVAARGLDIPQVDMVVHYQPPSSLDLYIHRSGRTARAQQSGRTIVLVGGKDSYRFHRLRKQRPEMARYPIRALALKAYQSPIKVATRIDILSRKLSKIESEKRVDSFVRAAMESGTVDSGWGEESGADEDEYEERAGERGALKSEMEQLKQRLGEELRRVG